MNKKLVFSFLFIFITTFVNAGDRGYYLFAWGNDSGKEYLKKYRLDDRKYEANDSCWDGRAGDSISAVYIDTYPQGITNPLVDSFLSGNSNAITRIRESLRNFSDDQVSPSHGFDGMIIVNKKGNNVEISTIPVKGIRYLYKRKFVISGEDYSVFDKQLCEALAPVDNYFSP
jgi:hypothetical protein